MPSSLMAATIPHHSELNTEETMTGESEKIDLDHNETPVCPHCGEAAQADWAYDVTDDCLVCDGDVCAVECCNCERYYTVQINIDYSYSSLESS